MKKFTVILDKKYCGGGIDMEKKLTDEEIVREYFHDCKKHSCETCSLGSIENCMDYVEDLIKRLQDENELLTEEKEKYKELYEKVYRNYSDLKHKEFNFNHLMQEKDEYLNKALELQDKVDELKKRLHMIFAIGVDYDGCDGVESLKELIDELVEITQMEGKEFMESYYGVQVEL